MAYYQGGFPPPAGAYPPPPPGWYPPPGPVVVSVGAPGYGVMMPQMAPPGVPPIPGLYISGPRVAPLPGQVVVAYEIGEPRVGCCECGDLNLNGMIALVILLLIFPPLAFIPCIMAECHQRYQHPVYGYPAGMPVAAPVAPSQQQYPGQAGPSQGTPYK